MKVVVLDGYTLNPGDLSWEELEKVSDLKVYDRTNPDQIEERIDNAEAILVNKVKISRDIIEKNKQLKYIGVLATGYDVVDIQAAKEAGIVVANIPTYGTDSVSQHAIALMLEIANRVGYHDQAVKEGRWATNPDWTFWDFPLIELSGKTMGIIGFGRIGQRTGEIAKALNMEVIANDPYTNPEMEEKGYKYVDLDYLFENSDVIVLHCNLTDENKGLINKENIAKMKKKPIIINNSRGQLVVEEDIAYALENNLLRGVGLDVMEVEPPKADNILYKYDNCILTPHLSWASIEARSRLLNQAVENIKSFMNGSPINQVNK